jgi:hypothetical protein
VSTITIKYKCHYAFFHRLQVQERTFIYRDLGPSSESYPLPQYHTIVSAAPLVTFLPVRSVGRSQREEEEKAKESAGCAVVYPVLAGAYVSPQLNQPTNQPRVTGRVEPNQLDDGDDDHDDLPRSFPVLDFHHSRVLTSSNKNNNAKRPLSGRDVKVK